MILVKSNIDNLIKSFEKFRNAYKVSLETIAERLGKVMCEEMISEIERSRSIWLQPNGNLENVANIDYTITKSGENFIRVTLGENLPLIKVGDTRYSLPQNKKISYVNPLYFIEFGWGVIGEQNPKNGTTTYSWKYNINEHGRQTQNPFYFWGNDGMLMKTQGREGVNFLYNTLEKYRTKWKQTLINLIKENM